MILRESKPDDPGIESLAEAIIGQAVRDYFYCLAHGHRPFGARETVNAKECETFFLSGWFLELAPGSRLSGELIIEELKKQAKIARNPEWLVKRTGYRSWMIYNGKTHHIEKYVYDTQYEAMNEAAKRNGLTGWQMRLAINGC